MDKKRLLFVGAYPPPYGGIASHLHALLPELIKHGYEVITLTDTKSQERTLESLGMKNIFMNTKQYFFKNMLPVLACFVPHLKSRGDLSWQEFIRVINLAHVVTHIAKREKVDAIFHYHIERGMTIPILQKNFSPFCPHVWMVFAECYVNPERYRKMANYLKHAFAQTHTILASSQYCADSISKVLDFDFPVKVVYIGIDDKLYIPSNTGDKIRNELGIPIDAFVFLFFGRMIQDMGVDFALDVAEQLLQIQPNIHLIIAGARGDFSEKVEELANAESRVHYCPDIPFEEKPNYYAACDVFLAPTLAKRACMGISIKEAMASGKPIIASNSGGIPEAVEHDVNGYLVPFRDRKLDGEIFIDYATRLASDPILCKKMGENSREKAIQLFSNDQTTQRYLDILHNILGQDKS